MASGPGAVPEAGRRGGESILPRPIGVPGACDGTRPEARRGAGPSADRGQPQLPTTPSESRVSFSESDATVTDARASVTVTSCTATPAGRYCATHTG
jgi:hypothetical protein